MTFFFLHIASVKTQEFKRFLKTHQQRIKIFVRKHFFGKAQNTWKKLRINEEKTKKKGKEKGKGKQLLEINIQ